MANVQALNIDVTRVVNVRDIVPSVPGLTATVLRQVDLYLEKGLQLAICLTEVSGLFQEGLRCIAKCKLISILQALLC